MSSFLIRLSCEANIASRGKKEKKKRIQIFSNDNLC
jgi:hypothetical protein